jgi:predicted transposase/invertase (TIGR01784 family)
MSNKSTSTPHDEFFKQVMSNPRNVRDFIRGFLPEAISCNIDLESIGYKDREKNTKRKRKFHLDMALTCKLSGQDAEIYIVLEHKSKADKITLVQILTYCAAVWEHNILQEKRSPVPIIPIVFYHGKEPFKLPEQFGDYFTVPDSLAEYMVNCSEPDRQDIFSRV